MKHTQESSFAEDVLKRAAFDDAAQRSASAAHEKSESVQKQVNGALPEYRASWWAGFHNAAYNAAKAENARLQPLIRELLETVAVTEKERAKWEDEYHNCAKFATAYEQQLVSLQSALLRVARAAQSIANQWRRFGRGPGSKEHELTESLYKIAKEAVDEHKGDK